jgi:hypothetical protein
MHGAITPLSHIFSYISLIKHDENYTVTCISVAGE